jgi:predicted acylesterase/phospholipase RssA
MHAESKSEVDSKMSLIVPLSSTRLEHSGIDIDTLMFGGGGIRGIAYIGVIRYLEQIGLLKNIKYFNGSSIGSFYALALVLGYTAKELYSLAYIIQFDKMFSTSIFNFWKKNSYSSDEYINKCIKNIISYKYHENLSFKELFDINNKYLTINVTNATKNIGCHMSHETHPNMPIWIAIRMSVSIPYIFPPVKYEDDYYIDGVISCNFPFYLYNNQTVLVLYLSAKQENPISSSFLGLFRSCIRSINSGSLQYCKNIINIDVSKYNVIERNLSEDDIEYIIRTGYNSTKMFFIQNNFSR